MSRSALFCTVVLAFALSACGGAPKPRAGQTRTIAIEDLGVGGPVEIEVKAPPTLVRGDSEGLAEFEIGRVVAARSGCLACHRIGDAGNGGPGPNLTHVGSILSPAQIERAILKPTEPMPSFAHLPAGKLHALVMFLSQLRG